MVQIIGKWLSPIKFTALIGLILIAFWSAPLCINDIGANAAVSNGFLSGYQTMDLFAAFFFSALIFSQIEKNLPSSASQKEIIRFAIKPSIIGASLIALAYFGFVFLGAHYAPIIANVSPELYLPTIAHHTMGNAATVFIAFAMPLSCLTTAVALNNIYARYICTTLKLENAKFPIILLGTTTMSFAISLLDFKGIAAFLAPMLQMSYPGLIALTILSLLTYHYKRLKIIMFYGITLFTALKVFL
jgi:LIVCS family branched-chain amino acid:cation transporter